MNDALEPSHQRLLGQLRTLFGAARQHISEVKRQTGITAAQLWALTEVVEHPGLGSGDLAQKMSIHPTTASNLLAQLKRRKLVRVKRDDMDGRLKHLHATTSGQRLYEAAPQPRRGTLPAAIASLSPAQRQSCEKALAALHEAVLAQGYDDSSLSPLARR